MRQQRLLALEKNVCRSCINKKYRINLLPKNCKYFYYHQKCTACGEMHQMIHSFTVSGKIKLLLAKAHS